MKTSYQLLILATVILLGTTAAYDIALQKVYLKGDYKNPYADYDQLDFKNFDEIEIVASNRISTTIIYSDSFNVKRLKEMKDVHIEQKGSTLIITLKEEIQSYRGGSGNDFIIKCPSLKKVSANPVRLADTTAVSTRKAKYGEYFGGRTSVNGFKLDSLKLIINNSSSITLQNNKLGFLNADIGVHDLSYSLINIDGTNEISSASLNLQRRSTMNLNNIDIKNLKYNLSDSAQVNLSGISLRLLSNK